MTAFSDLIARSSLGDTSVRLAKVIIAGSRGLVVDDYDMQRGIDRLLDEHGIIPGEVVSGCAVGPDRTGERWAASHDPWTVGGIKIARFPITPADWRAYGKFAGPRRNAEMAEYADALLAFWDGKSRGTKDMIDQMRRRQKPVVVVEVKP